MTGNVRRALTVAAMAGFAVVLTVATFPPPAHALADSVLFNQAEGTGTYCPNTASPGLLYLGQSEQGSTGFVKTTLTGADNGVVCETSTGGTTANSIFLISAANYYYATGQYLSRMQVFVCKKSSAGIFQYNIDDERSGSFLQFDEYATGTTCTSAIGIDRTWSAPSDQHGSHTAWIQALNTQNVSSSNQKINVDYIKLTYSDVPVTTTTTTTAPTTTTTVAPTTTTVAPTTTTWGGTLRTAAYKRQHDVENLRGDVLYGGAIVIALSSAIFVSHLVGGK